MKLERDLRKPKHTVFVDSSDDDNEPSLNKLRYDSTKNYDNNSNQRRGSFIKEDSQIEPVVMISKSDSMKKREKNSFHAVDQNQESFRKNQKVSQQNKSKSESTTSKENNCKPKHTVFVDSSDDENETSVRQLRYDSTKNYEKNSSHVVDEKRESSSEEDSQVESVVNKSRSDSTKKCKHNSSIAKKEKLSRSVSRRESISSTVDNIDRSKKKSKSDHTKKSENNSVQKQGSFIEEVSPFDLIVTESVFDSTNNSSHPVDQNQESSFEDVSEIKSEKKINPYEKRNETLLRCLICNEFRTCVVTTFRIHLKRKHSTTFGLAGMFLRCDCGHESQSAADGHLSKCDIANYTVIRKNEGPIQTFHDKKMTPPCFLCGVYPRTAKGYAVHLTIHHSTTLKANQKFLICSCGNEVTSDNINRDHKKKCDGRKFSLHELDEE